MWRRLDLPTQSACAKFEGGQAPIRSHRFPWNPDHDRLRETGRISMRRRDFIAGLGAAVCPLAARSQQGEQVRRVGVLSFGAERDPNSQLLQKMAEELLKRGWIEGCNLRLEYRFGAGDQNRMRDFAVDLVRLAPDVIVVGFGTALRAMQQETKTIPIVVLGACDIIVTTVV
jgi:putative ABC transport system substrate-binding protein